jgi:hypothetical protein
LGVEWATITDNVLVCQSLLFVHDRFFSSSTSQFNEALFRGGDNIAPIPEGAAFEMRRAGETPHLSGWYRLLP